MPSRFPNEAVSIDIVDPLLLPKKGNRYVLVMVDYFTKVVIAEPINRRTLKQTRQCPAISRSVIVECLNRSTAIKVFTLNADPSLNYA